MPIVIPNTNASTVKSAVVYGTTKPDHSLGDYLLIHADGDSRLFVRVEIVNEDEYWALEAAQILDDNEIILNTISLCQ